MSELKKEIIIHELSLSYAQKTVWENLHARFSMGVWHGILGSSGVGKSTFLRTIAGLLTPSSGTVQDHEGNDLKGRIAWMGQDDLLLPWLSALDNVCLAYRLRGEKTKAIEEKAKNLLSLVGLVGLERRMPYELSGGQRQRVALARTLLEDKPIVLMDEPFSALDVATSVQLHRLFAELLKGKTVIFITHQPLEALRLSQEVWLMHGEKVNVEHMTHLDSPCPRALDDVDVLRWQAKLLHMMMQGK